MENALGVIALAFSQGLSLQEIAKGLKTFSGVKRRQEIRGELNGAAIIDDFAHHPTAVRLTLNADSDRRAVEIPVGEFVGDAAEIDNRKIEFPEILLHPRPAPDDLLKFGHAADI